MTSRPRHVTVAAWIWIVAGAGCVVLMLPLILLVADLIAPGEPSTPGPLAADMAGLGIFVIAPLALFLSLVLVGFKVLAGRRWARNAGLVLSAVAVTMIPGGGAAQILAAIVWIYVAVSLLGNGQWFNGRGEQPDPAQSPPMAVR